jgi:hypothetical protein
MVTARPLAEPSFPKKQWPEEKRRPNCLALVHLATPPSVFGSRSVARDGIDRAVAYSIPCSADFRGPLTKHHSPFSRPRGSDRKYSFFFCGTVRAPKTWSKDLEGHMVTLLFCLAWGALVFPFVLLARISVKSTPKPPELLPSRDLQLVPDKLLRIPRLPDPS